MPEDALHTDLPLTEFGPPEVIEIEPTHNCNLRCIQCHVTYRGVKKERLDPDFPRRLKGLEGKWVMLGAQFEPMVHPKFCDFAAELSDMGMKLGMTTNGTLFTPKVIDRIGECNFKLVNISFDGIRKETYESIRHNAVFERTIERIAAFRETFDRSKTYISCNNVIMRRNVDELPEALEFWEHADFDHMGVILMTIRDLNPVLNAERLEDAMDHVRDVIDETVLKMIENEYRITMSCPLIGQSRLKADYPDNFRGGMAISANPDAQLPTNPRIYFQSGPFPGMHVNCRSPFKMVRVAFNGNVYLCNNFKIGNIHEMDLLDIWYGDLATRHRRSVMASTKICETCDYYRFCIKAQEIDFTKKDNHYSGRFLNKEPVFVGMHNDFMILKWDGKYFGVPENDDVPDLLDAYRQGLAIMEEDAASVRRAIDARVAATARGTAGAAVALAAGDGSGTGPSAQAATPAAGRTSEETPATARPTRPDATDPRVIRTALAAQALQSLVDDPNQLYLLHSVCPNPGDLRAFVEMLGREGMTTPADVLVKLIQLQMRRIAEAVDPTKKTIAIYAPTKAYREHIDSLGRKLRQHGYNAINLFGTVCDDAFENQEHAYYAGHGIVELLDCVDVFIVPCLMDELPAKAIKVYMLHDIYISPPGNPVHENGTRLTYDYVVSPTRFHFDAKGADQTLRKRVEWARDQGLMNDPTYRDRCRWPKAIIPGGYVKLDKAMAYFDLHARDEKTIIYAPTVDGGPFDVVASLTNNGYGIVATILERFPDYRLIFRPHPHTLESDAVRRIRDDFSAHPRFELDDGGSYLDNYSRAALMVTDMSGTAFTYAFMTGRPVVFFSPDEEGAQRIFKGIRYFQDRERIGFVAENLSEMERMIGLAIERAEEKSVSVRRFRDDIIFNVGRCEDYLVENFSYILDGTAGDRHPDWIYVDEPRF